MGLRTGIACSVVGAGLLLALLLGGCAGALLLAYTGGGLPPGETDIGGVVLASLPAATVSAAQVTEPVVGAEVQLMRGTTLVGEATTGEGGYFRFENPASGSYRVVVNPPPNSGLQQAQREFEHQYGQQTFLTILLEPEE